MRYRDRRSAGEALGNELALLGPHQPVVLALPRGGVPIGYEVARSLVCDLDVLVVRKLGLPSQPELAMGAVAEGDVLIRNDDVIRLAGVETSQFDRVAELERQELQRRLVVYRGDAPRVQVIGRTAIIVDDGLATGSTAIAGVEALRSMGATEVWVAVPVAPRDTARLVEQITDRLVVMQQPLHFQAVGAWYRDFSQTTDDEVKDLLAKSRLR